MARSRHAEWSDAAMVLALLAFGISLCFLGMGLLAQWQESAARQQDESLDVLLGSVAAAAGIGLLLWWAFSILSAGAALLLERLGRGRAAAAARRLSPAFMQRAVVAALSVQLIAGTAANAASTVPGPEWTPTQTHSASAPPSFAAPGDALDGAGKDSQGGSQTTAPAVSGYPPATRSENQAAVPDGGSLLPAATANPGWQPAPPVLEPGLLAGAAPRSMAGLDAGAQVAAITVLSGDTLWDIVSAYLGPGASEVDIALEWPRWYAANRGLIGESPDVLLPGQILHAPAAS